MPNPEWGDDLNVGSCAQVDQDSKKRDSDDTYYQDVVPLRKNISEPFAEEFSMTAQEFLDMNMVDVGLHADIKFAEKF